MTSHSKKTIFLLTICAPAALWADSIEYTQDSVSVISVIGSLNPENQNPRTRSMLNFNMATPTRSSYSLASPSCYEEDGGISFSQKLSESLSPFSLCKKELEGYGSQRDYCECMSTKQEIITVSEMTRLRARLKVEAASMQKEIVKANIGVLEDKLTDMIGLYHQLKNQFNDFNPTCSPDKLISSFQASGQTGACENGKINEIDKFLGGSNNFETIVNNVKKFSDDNKSLPLNVDKLFANVDKLSEVLFKAVKFNKGEIKKAVKFNEGEIKLTKTDALKLKKEIEVVINAHPVFKSYRFPLHVGGDEQVVANDFTEFGSFGQDDLYLALVDMIDTDHNQKLSQDTIFDSISKLTDQKIKEFDDLCNQVSSNVQFICAKALNTNYTVSLIQNRPEHLAKLAMPIFKTQDTASYADYQMEQVKKQLGQMGLGGGGTYGFSGTNFGEPLREFENKELSDKIDLLQCSFTYADLATKITPGLAVEIEDPLFAMGYFTDDFSSSIGHSDDFFDLIGAANAFDPFKELTDAVDKQSVQTTITNKGRVDINKYRVVDIERRQRKSNDILNRAFSDFSSKPGDPGAPAGKSVFGSSATATSSEHANSANDSSSNYSQQASSPSSSYLGMPTPLSTGQSSSQSTTSSSSATVEATTPQTIQSQIDSYEQRLATMMEKMAQFEQKQKARIAAGTSSPEEELAESNASKGLKDTISELKQQIAALEKQKQGITNKSTPATRAASQAEAAAPVRNIFKAQKVKTADTPAAVAAPVHAPAKTSAQNYSAGPSNSSAQSTAPAFSSTVGRDLTLRAESLEGKTVVSAKEFKTSDPKYLSELFEKSGGEPIYVSQVLPDGREEIIVYEAVKLPDGTITYVEQKQATAAAPKAAKTSRPPSASESKAQSKRKKVKVEDLNQLIQTVK